MYPRLLEPPNHSFFLFGPRATGKTTWLRGHLQNAAWFNLLRDEDFLPLLGSSSLLRDRVEALASGSWVVIDEVQRLPGLLNEVHDLISIHGDAYKFALSGSSARKLRRLDVNLLAGRAIQRAMFPLVSAELGDDFDLETALRYGTLPGIYADHEYRVDKLRAYVHTYLRQEVQQEALVKDLGSFHRFLNIAALMHGQTVNQAAISRDAAVARSTVQRFFETLVDTLIGVFLPAWRPKAKVRASSGSRSSSSSIQVWCVQSVTLPTSHLPRPTPDRFSKATFSTSSVRRSPIEVSAANWATGASQGRRRSTSCGAKGRRESPSK